ncbi:cation-translocating P-type ATPase [Faecousia sp.]|uniref:cation-translocating P-type ATPase n=1 Tax=Faecousia sp. TaxID=2952921 RepID=UPI003A903933
MKQKSKLPHLRVYRQIPMLQADPAEGLSPQETKLRQSNGLSNIMPPSNTKSEGQIIKENVLTFFNLIFLVLALCLCLVGSFKNLMFLLVAVANTVVGSFQEIRAKRAVDKLTLVAAGTAKAIRSGQRVSVRTDQLVRDDIVEFAAGDQICADAVVRDGQLQVNESLLTGEADAILKNPGDTLKSGSFVISGRARVQLTHVGSESYAAKLAAEARRNVRSTKSEMMLSLTKLITVVGIALIPLGIILFLRHFLSVFQGLPLRDSVESTVSALIGMIPEGLYLLTSVAIAASCLKLSRKRVLVQDMNCIETLAHVDVLCVDKTGTITEPTMEVTDVYPLNSERFSYDDIEKILAAFYHGEEPDNETARAMGQQFAGETSWRAVKRMAFSSSTKWSGADFGENGRYVVGAPEFIMGDRYDSIRSEAEPWSERGCRVLLLAAYDTAFDDGPLQSAHVAPIALVFLSNLLRPDAQETFRYFASQGVSVRVISGDNPITVAQVATRAGIENADRYVDATTLSTEQDFEEAVKYYTVFGRVTPEQKRYLVRAFQKQGHTVAMTGDGVNDVLALKDANCGIAMASGSQAASQVAQIVLLNSQFSAMPAIVAEGRRVINNIQRAASLFLVKNIFSFALTLLLLFIDMPYPLLPIQLSLISTFTIGIPSFFLALEPNYARVEGKFMRNVIRRAMPGGLTNLTIVLLAGFFTSTFGLSNEQLNTICVWVMSAVGLVTLYHVSVPFTRLRLAVLAAMTAAMLFSLLVIPAFFDLPALNASSALILVTLLLACPTVMRFFRVIFDKRVAKLDLAPAKKQKKRHRFEK